MATATDKNALMTALDTDKALALLNSLAPAGTHFEKEKQYVDGKGNDVAHDHSGYQSYIYRYNLVMDDGKHANVDIDQFNETLQAKTGMSFKRDYITENIYLTQTEVTNGAVRRLGKAIKEQKFVDALETFQNSKITPVMTDDLAIANLKSLRSKGKQENTEFKAASNKKLQAEFIEVLDDLGIVTPTFERLSINRREGVSKEGHFVFAKQMSLEDAGDTRDALKKKLQERMGGAEIKVKVINMGKDEYGVAITDNELLNLSKNEGLFDGEKFRPKDEAYDATTLESKTAKDAAIDMLNDIVPGNVVFRFDKKLGYVATMKDNGKDAIFENAADYQKKFKDAGITFTPDPSGKFIVPAAQLSTAEKIAGVQDMMIAEDIDVEGSRHELKVKPELDRKQKNELTEKNLADKKTVVKAYQVREKFIGLIKGLELGEPKPEITFDQTLNERADGYKIPAARLRVGTYDTVDVAKKEADRLQSELNDRLGEGQKVTIGVYKDKDGKFSPEITAEQMVAMANNPKIYIKGKGVSDDIVPQDPARLQDLQAETRYTLNGIAPEGVVFKLNADNSRYVAMIEGSNTDRAKFDIDAYNDKLKNADFQLAKGADGEVYVDAKSFSNQSELKAIRDKLADPKNAASDINPSFRAGISVKPALSLEKERSFKEFNKEDNNKYQGAQKIEPAFAGLMRRIDPNLTAKVESMPITYSSGRETIISGMVLGDKNLRKDEALLQIATLNPLLENELGGAKIKLQLFGDDKNGYRPYLPSENMLELAKNQKIFKDGQFKADILPLNDNERDSLEWSTRQMLNGIAPEGVNFYPGKDGRYEAQTNGNSASFDITQYNEKLAGSGLQFEQDAVSKQVFVSNAKVSNKEELAGVKKNLEPLQEDMQAIRKDTKVTAILDAFDKADYNKELAKKTATMTVAEAKMPAFAALIKKADPALSVVFEKGTEPAGKAGHTLPVGQLKIGEGYNTSAEATAQAAVLKNKLKKLGVEVAVNSYTDETTKLSYLSISQSSMLALASNGAVFDKKTNSFRNDISVSDPIARREITNAAENALTAIAPKSVYFNVERNNYVALDRTNNKPVEFDIGEYNKALKDTGVQFMQKSNGEVYVEGQTFANSDRVQAIQNNLGSVSATVAPLRDSKTVVPLTENQKVELQTEIIENKAKIADAEKIEGAFKTVVKEVSSKAFEPALEKMEIIGKNGREVPVARFRMGDKTANKSEADKQAKELTAKLKKRLDNNDIQVSVQEYKGANGKSSFAPVFTASDMLRTVDDKASFDKATNSFRPEKAIKLERMLDTDKDGSIDPRELQEALKKAKNDSQLMKTLNIEGNDATIQKLSEELKKMGMRLTEANPTSTSPGIVKLDQPRSMDKGMA